MAVCAWALVSLGHLCETDNAMHPSVQMLLENLRPVLEDLDEAQTQLHPMQDAARWSVEQTIGHLVMTYRSTGQLLRDRLAKARPVSRGPKLQERLLRGLVLTMGVFPRGISAPDAVRPERAGLPPVNGQGLVRTLQAELESMETELESCRHTFGTKFVATHFALGPMSVEQWYRFHQVHGLHHRKQVLRIRKALGLPAR